MGQGDQGTRARHRGETQEGDRSDRGRTGCLTETTSRTWREEMSLGIDAFVADLLKFSENNNRQPLYEEIGEILVASIEKNFREGGRYGVGGGGEFVGGPTKWIESSRAKKQSGKTLVDTAQLSTSITYEATASGVEVGTNKIYGAIQHFGGETGKNKAVTLLARPYLVVQDEDLEEISLATVKHFRGIDSV